MAETDIAKIEAGGDAIAHVLADDGKKKYGQFLTKRRQGQQPRKIVLESAFENTKPYELTELGSQFVHYVMDEVAPRVGDAN